MSQPCTLLLLGRAGFGGTEGPDFTRYLVICGLLILAVAGVGFGFRKLMTGSLRNRSRERSLRVLDVLPMGGKKRLCVVRCYDRTFVVGEGEKELTYLAELDSVDVPERVIPAAPVAPPVTSGREEREDFDAAGFEQVLERARERMHAARQKLETKARRETHEPVHELERPRPTQAGAAARPQHKSFESLA